MGFLCWFIFKPGFFIVMCSLVVLETDAGPSCWLVLLYVPPSCSFFLSWLLLLIEIAIVVWIFVCKKNELLFGPYLDLLVVWKTLLFDWLFWTFVII